MITANRIYKEEKKSGRTTLSFKDWIEREKNKNFLNADGMPDSKFMLNEPLTKGIEDTLERMRAIGKSDVKTEQSGKTVLGIPVITVVAAVLIIGGAVAYNFYQKKAK